MAVHSRLVLRAIVLRAIECSNDAMGRNEQGDIGLVINFTHGCHFLWPRRSVGHSSYWSLCSHGYNDKLIWICNISSIDVQQSANVTPYILFMCRMSSTRKDLETISNGGQMHPQRPKTSNTGRSQIAGTKTCNSSSVPVKHKLCSVRGRFPKVLKFSLFDNRSDSSSSDGLRAARSKRAD